MSTTVVGLAPELESRIAAAVAANAKPDLTKYPASKDGEEIVGVITDARLLAMVMLTDQLHQELTSRWPRKPADPAELETALEKKGEMDALKNEVWKQTFEKFALSVETVDNVGFRANGNDLVVVKWEDDLPDFGALLSLPSGDECATCTDTGCPQHPNYTPAASTDMQ